MRRREATVGIFIMANTGFSFRKWMRVSLTEVDYKSQVM
jgi:hypothetical protein